MRAKREVTPDGRFTLSAVYPGAVILRSLFSLLLLTCVLVTPPRVQAQRLPPFLASTGRLEPASPPRAARLPFGHPADYRTEGMIAGAALIGIPTTILAFGFCADTDSGGGNCLTGGVAPSLLGLFVGGLAGALIGGAIPKAQSPSSASVFVQAPGPHFKPPALRRA